MNTSFSKKRHIIEANQRLEERYLKYVILEQLAIININDIADNLHTEIQKPNSDEVKIVNYINQINTQEKFNELLTTYKNKYNIDFGVDLAKALTPVVDRLQVSNMQKHLSNFLKITSTFKNAVSNSPDQWIFSGSNINKNLSLPFIPNTNSNLNTSQIISTWSKYPCVPRTQGAKLYPESNAYLINNIFYYSSGTYQTQDQSKKGKYYCNRNGGISFNDWVNCTDNYKLNCVTKSPSGPMSTDIGKLQSCLGFTGKSVDGYFGKNTETALHNKFPEFKGKVVTKTNINTICSGRAGTAGTSGTAGVTNNQIRQYGADDTTPEQ